MQCPDCGRQVDDFIDGSCGRCASQRIIVAALPEYLGVTTCAHCGKVEDGNRWVDMRAQGRDEVLTRVREALVLEPRMKDVTTEYATHVEDEHNFRVNTHVKGDFAGVAVEAHPTTRVRLRNGVCTDCSRRVGGYFEAIIQLRGHPERPLDDVDGLEDATTVRLQQLYAQGRQGAFFSKIERVRGGIDFYAGSLEVARVLVRDLGKRWGAEHGESATVVGRTDDGRDMHRVTLLVRLPKWHPGDFVRVANDLYKVLGVQRRSLRMLRLRDWAELRRDPHRLPDLRWVAGRQAEREAIVVTRHGSEAQVLDPESLRAVDVVLPKSIEYGPTMPVVRDGQDLWVLPPNHAMQ